MRVPTLLAFLFVLSAPAIATAKTITRGSVELKGSASFGHSSTDVELLGEVSTTSLSVRPTVGVALTDNFEFGATVDYLVSSTDIEGPGPDGSNSSIGVVPTLICNFKTSGAATPYLSAGYGFMVYNGDYDDFGDDATEMIFPALEAGVRCFIAEEASLNFSAAYTHIANSAGQKDQERNTFSVGVGFSVFLMK